MRLDPSWVGLLGRPGSGGIPRERYARGVEAPRIVSLLPSLTEIACALGLEDRLVGRSHECDHPASVTRLPVCTEPSFDVTGRSAEIDARVRRLVREGLSIYRVDPGVLRSLAPDLVLTQDQCEVCAASLSDVERALADWTGGAPRVLSLCPATLGDVVADVGRVAAAAGVGERGAAVAASLLERVSTLGERSGALPRRRVACLEWLDPPMCAGHWIPELVTLAGGENLFGTAGADSRTLEWARLVEADPEVIVAFPCGFDLARTRSECAALTGRPGWSGLRAVAEGRVYLADGNAFFNRPGPRLVESAELLAEMLHPDVFGTEGEGVAWERL